jgi:tetratricopeptide (TPR) repeat protein
MLIRRHPSAAQAAAPTHTANPEAQELYLQGRYYWNKRTPQDLNKAVDYFTQAIVHDPNYSQAYVGLADCYNLLREFAAMPQGEAYPRALAAAQKAVELDDSSAEAHASLAFVELYWKWDVHGAESEFLRAIKLNPNYATAHHWYANFLALAGRYPEALEQINRAQQIDPGSNAIVADRALVLFELGRVDEALAILKGIESSQPSFYSSHQYLSYIYFSRRDFTHFVAESTKSAELSGDQSQFELAHAAEQGYQSGGERGVLESMLKVYEKLYQRGQGSPYLVALGYARLKENDQALQYLQKAYQQHDPNFLGIRDDSAFLALHDQAEFRALERKSGLPPLT